MGEIPNLIFLGASGANTWVAIRKEAILDNYESILLQPHQTSPLTPPEGGQQVVWSFVIISGNCQIYNGEQEKFIELTSQQFEIQMMHPTLQFRQAYRFTPSTLR